MNWKEHYNGLVESALGQEFDIDKLDGVSIADFKALAEKFSEARSELKENVQDDCKEIAEIFEALIAKAEKLEEKTMVTDVDTDDAKKNSGDQVNSPEGIDDQTDEKKSVGDQGGAESNDDQTDEGENVSDQDNELDDIKKFEVNDDATDAGKIAPRGVIHPDMVGESHFKALFDGVELAEEAKERMKTVFETAVLETSEKFITEAEERIHAEAAEELAGEIRKLQEQVEEYTSHVAQEFIKENKVAVHSGLRQEISESLLVSLKNVLIEHNVDIPEDKVDILEQMDNENSELEAQLEEAKKEVEAHKVARVLEEATNGMSDRQAEKFVELCKYQKYTNADEFAVRVNHLKESYKFNDKEETLTEDKNLTEDKSSKIGSSIIDATLNDNKQQASTNSNVNRYVEFHKSSL